MEAVELIVELLSVVTLSTVRLLAATRIQGTVG